MNKVLLVGDVVGAPHFTDTHVELSLETTENMRGGRVHRDTHDLLIFGDAAIRSARKRIRAGVTLSVEGSLMYDREDLVSVNVHRFTVVEPAA